MRGSFALVVLSMIGAVATIGCGDASVDIAAEQHGKRLNLVNGDSSEVTDPVISAQPKATYAPAAANAYRDLAGVVLSSRSGSELHEWLLAEDGATLITRTCPVDAKTGVNFFACGDWSAPAPVSSIGLEGPVRSFSTYVFSQADGSVALEESVFDMSGGTRSERTCAIDNGVINEAACGDWTPSQEATALGIPQERAFEDEVVVSYVDAKGILELSQEVVSLTGSKSWQRTCAEGDATPCNFSSATSISELGLHFETIEGIGGYTYVEGDQMFYAETVIAPGGTMAERRLCPMTAIEGVQADKCKGWEAVDLTAIPAANRAAL